MAAKPTILSAVLFVLLISGCSTHGPLWYQKAEQTVQAARSEGAPALVPSEFASLSDTFTKGELLLLEKNIGDADKLFKLVILKGQLLSENSATEKRRIAEVDRVRLLEQQQLETERLEALEREKYNRRREAEVVRARIAEQAQIDAAAEAHRQAERLKMQKVRQILATSHTVKRGESLPQIAALPEVYNDPLLWPLVYRANRDQISDPRNLWPGQKLRIPRNYSSDDVQEARRYAQEKRFR